MYVEEAIEISKHDKTVLWSLCINVKVPELALMAKLTQYL